MRPLSKRYSLLALLVSILSFNKQAWCEPEADPQTEGTKPRAVSKFENASSYSFNPLAAKRDPFAPPSSAFKGIVNELQRYDLNEFTLVGILTGQGQPQAMIVVPGGSSHIVKVGDALGKRNGRVSKITLNEVIVKESYKDYHDRVSTETTALVLAQ